MTAFRLPEIESSSVDVSFPPEDGQGGKSVRTSKALNAFPLKSLRNSLASSELLIWTSTILLEGETSRIRRRHSMSDSRGET